MSEITRSPLCWPNNVPRTLPYNRERARFAIQSIHAATTEVLHEINRLNGRSYDYDDESVIVSTNCKLKTNGLPNQNFVEPAEPGVAVYFNLRFYRNGKWFERPCVLTCDKWNKVAFNLTAIAKDIYAQRARDRWGATNIEQAFRGYLAIPEQCGGKAWWDLLNVSAQATQQQVKDAYRALAKTMHPDVSGESRRPEWNGLQAAYDEAMSKFR